jgi:hypothetical protein
MADDDTKAGMAKAERHVYGPRAVGALVPALTRPAFRRTAPAAAQIMIDWPSIVGPALAAVTAPRRLSGGTLTIACSGPIAMELQHMAIELIHRINAHVGTPTVRALRFMQVALTARPVAPPVAYQAAAAAEAAVAHLPAGELRDALAALGRRVLAPRHRSARNAPNR